MSGEHDGSTLPQHVTELRAESGQPPAEPPAPVTPPKLERAGPSAAQSATKPAFAATVPGGRLVEGVVTRVDERHSYALVESEGGKAYIPADLFYPEDWDALVVDTTRVACETRPFMYKAERNAAPPAVRVISVDDERY